MPQPDFAIAKPTGTHPALNFSEDRTVAADEVLTDLFSRINQSSSSPVSHKPELSKVESPKKLTSLTLAWSEDASIDTIGRMRSQIVEQLNDVVFSFEKNMAVSDMRFSQQEVATLTHFIFESVFGRGGLNRTASILRALRASSSDDRNQVTTSILAANLANDERIPSQLRSFFGLYATYSRDALNQNNPVKQLLQFYERYQLYNQYASLLYHMSDKTRQFLRSHNYTTSRGRGWKSVIQTFLADSLKLTTVQLANALQESQTLYILVEAFGSGVLVFLPGYCMNL
jgi:hypothetical protein